MNPLELAAIREELKRLGKIAKRPLGGWEAEADSRVVYNMDVIGRRNEVRYGASVYAEQR